MLSEKLKTISENYKGLTKEEVDELTIENIFMKLVNDMEGFAHIGNRKYRIFKNYEHQYAFDDADIKPKIIRRLVAEGFVVNTGKQGGIFGLSYTDIDW